MTGRKKTVREGFREIPGDNKSFCTGLAALIGILSYWIKFELKKKKEEQFYKMDLLDKYF